MALDEWQQEYLAGLGDRAIPGLSAEDTRGLVAGFAFREHPPEFEGAMERLGTGGAGEVRLRYFGLGMEVADAQAADTARHAQQGGPTAERHPDFDVLAAMSEEISRIPDVRALHAYAQASLLNAIQRFADAAETVEDVQRIADAYLTLPPPDEDFPDDG